MRIRNKIVGILTVFLLVLSSCELLEDNNVEGNSADKTALVSAIESANTLIDGKTVGEDVGNVSQEDYDAYEAAIVAAGVVAADPDASQEDVDGAVSALASATTSFNDAVLTEEDVNPDNPEPSDDPAEVVNGDFATDLGTEWVTWAGTAENIAISVVSGELKVEVLSASNNSYDPKVYQTGINFLDGETYIVSFDAKADVARDIVVQVGLQIGEDPWFYPYMADAVVRGITTSMETYTFSFTAENDGHGPGDLIFEVGAGAETNIYLDNITVTTGSVIDTYDLEAAIVTATALVDSKTVGSEDGNVSQDDKDTYTAAIAAAQAVVDNAEATQEEIDTAEVTLGEATTEFNLSIISLVVGTIADFDEDAAPVLTGFGSNTDPVIDVDPVDAANNVLKFVKPADAETWAGVTVSTEYLDSIPEIIFTEGNTLIKVDVYSAAVGTTVRLKVENAEVPSVFAEVDVVTTVADAWETLVFDFNSVANLENTYNKLSVFPGFLADNDAEEITYIDNILFMGELGGVLREIDLDIEVAVALKDSLTVGSEAGNVSQETMDAFEAAIAVAQGVADDTSATDSDIETALTDLDAAVVAFNEAIIPLSSSVEVELLTINGVATTPVSIAEPGWGSGTVIVTTDNTTQAYTPAIETTMASGWGGPASAIAIQVDAGALTGMTQLSLKFKSTHTAVGADMFELQIIGAADQGGAGTNVIHDTADSWDAESLDDGWISVTFDLAGFGDLSGATHIVLIDKDDAIQTSYVTDIQFTAP